MERIDVFDPKGKGCSDAAWEKLPSAFRLFVQGVQMRIQNEVEKENPGEFRPTSGFRSIPGNFLVGGKPNSRHLCGCARDFVRMAGGLGDHPPRVGDGFRVIRSDGCWHVEVI